MALLQSEWREAQTAAWAPGLAVAEAEYRFLCSHDLWQESPADFFWVVGIGRKELQHSRILGWLLDPKQGHGLGATFAEAMLRLAVGKRPERVPERITVRSVRREETRWTPDGCETRADLAVYGDGFMLVIEVKVDAEEQCKQCERLIKCFENDGASYVFLSRDSKPRTDKEGRFQTVYWWQVRRALEEALDHAPNRSAPDRALARNYVLTLRRNFE